VSQCVRVCVCVYVDYMTETHSAQLTARARMLRRRPASHVTREYDPGERERGRERERESSMPATPPPPPPPPPLCHSFSSSSSSGRDAIVLSQERDNLFGTGYGDRLSRAVTGSYGPVSMPVAASAGRDEVYAYASERERESERESKIEKRERERERETDRQRERVRERERERDRDRQTERERDPI
jgi:hypothetical protein